MRVAHKLRELNKRVEREYTISIHPALLFGAERMRIESNLKNIFFPTQNRFTLTYHHLAHLLSASIKCKKVSEGKQIITQVKNNFCRFFSPTNLK